MYLSVRIKWINICEVLRTEPDTFYFKTAEKHHVHRVYRRRECHGSGGHLYKHGWKPGPSTWVLSWVSTWLSHVCFGTVYIQLSVSSPPDVLCFDNVYRKASKEIMNVYQETLSIMPGTVEIQMKKKCSLPCGNLQSGWTDEISSMKHYRRVQESIKC